MTDTTPAPRAQMIVAGYKKHGTVRDTAAALGIGRDTISRILREEGVLRPQGPSKTFMTCEQCQRRRRVNPNAVNNPVCSTCRETAAQMAAIDANPAVIKWERRGLIQVAVETYDPQPDTNYRRESAA